MDERRVYVHSGVAVGRVVADDVVVDWEGIRIGCVDADGAVEDWSGVRVGAVAGAAGRHRAAA